MERECGDRGGGRLVLKLADVGSGHAGVLVAGTGCGGWGGGDSRFASDRSGVGGWFGGSFVFVQVVYRRNMATGLEQRRGKGGKGPESVGVLFGSHLSVAGGMVNALHEARSLGLDAVQVFTKNQQQWKAPAMKPEARMAWLEGLAELGWADADPLDPAGAHRTVSHASYLINLASPDDALWAKSIDMMVVEIERCDVLGIPLLVHHPGAFTTSDREAGLGRIVSAYEVLFERTPGAKVVNCLENTVGSGSNLGGAFGELAELRERIVQAAGRAERVGFCFDTCHAHAAGYDMHGEQAAAKTLDELDRVCGLEHVRCVHLNDSKGACGSRLDRHEHIGEGTIGEAGFGVVLGQQALRGRPMILETPKGKSEDGTPLDEVNLRRLRRLVMKP